MTLFDVAGKIVRRQELEARMNADGFWENQEAAKPIIAEARLLKSVIEPVETNQKAFDDIKTLHELGVEMGDEASIAEADGLLAALESKFDALELQSLLSSKEDPLNCYVTIQAGAGGTEAQDWADMLSRMYLYFWENRGWDVSEVDRQYGEQAGIKSATFYVKAPYAFGYMRMEHGTHRLVRISPFNAQAKRQTSFAGVSVEPEFPDAGTSSELPPADLEIVAFVRASGPGGQNVNKVASACRITHKPTGVTVTCSVERSLQQNIRLATGILANKIELAMKAKQDAALKEIVGEKGTADFGTQIRSYVLDDRRVKDHRTNVETSRVEEVLDRGNIDMFIDAELRRRKAKAGAAHA